MAEQLSEEQQQQMVEGLFGKVITHESEKLGITIPNAIKVAQSLVFIVSDKHVRWFKNIYSTFDKWITNPTEPIEQADIFTVEGDRFDAMLFDKRETFAHVFNELADVEMWTEEIWNQKMLAFFEATGQTEKLEALQSKLEGENE